MQKTSRTDNSPVLQGHYWAVENIRTISGLGDLSIAGRNQLPYGEPDRLFNLYVEHGIAKVATRPYPSFDDKTWTVEFEVGEAKVVAIEFDGYWRMHDLKWRFITDEFPHLFWVDDSGKLFVQTWDDVESRIELAADVEKIKAIRAWKNVSFPEQDLGLVAAYIKTDGKVYYRGYCTQIDGRVVWETETEIEEFTGTAVSLNLFRTNDYRTGIVIEDNQGKIHMLITDRNWAGMAIAPEYLSVAPISVVTEFIPLEFITAIHTEHLSVAPTDITAELLFANTENEILFAGNIPVTKIDENDEEYDDWGWVIEVRVKNPIPVLALGEVTATDIISNTLIQMDSIDRIDDYTFRLNATDVVVNGFNNLLGNIRIDIVGVKNPAGYIYENMTKTFAPVNLVPEFIPLPEVDSIWNE